uniref:(northern house mosquito) hypothetical protein n=1 Tax=Culex pipiens TaxID=7175 RepID=A0A8D8A6B7_CULPI
MDDGLHLRGRLLVDLLAKCPRFHVPTWLYNVQRFITRMEDVVGVPHQRVPVTWPLEPRREVTPLRHRSPLQGHYPGTHLGTLQPVTGRIPRLGQLVLGVGVGGSGSTDLLVHEAPVTVLVRGRMVVRHQSNQIPGISVLPPG